MTSFETKPASAEEPDREDARLLAAEEWLASPDLYTREAGAQALAGLTTPDALRLLEKACADREARVVEGGLRALLASAASGASDTSEAEATLLRVLTKAGSGNRVREMLFAGGQDRTGVLPESGHDARRFRFLSANPDLARCRLSSLEDGTYRSVQAFRSGRLRANPSFTALFDVIRGDPDLPRTLKAMLARRTEFITQGGEPRSLEPFWGDIRRMTGLLAGFAADPAITALCEFALDRTVTRETQTLWSRLKTEVPYVSELVVGAGPHAANFCSTLAILRPARLPLVVERRERIGGQFAAPEGAAWYLNSRSRPSAEDRRSAPGSGHALNAIGAYAPVQEADLTGQSYASQDRLALATRLSLFLSCHAMVGTAFVQRLPNNVETRERLGFPPDAVPSGRYLAALQNIRTGERGYLATDAILYAGGLGEPNLAFRDPVSRKAATEERDQARRGLPARYYTFDDFMARLTDPNNPFPLRGLDRVVVVGDGDSARVTIEALLGYGPPAGRTVNGLDRVQEVIWIGQEATTREEFLECQRPRYHLLALEFPREGRPASSARIRPVAERAAGFAVEKDQGIVTTVTGARYAGAVVIDCTGFAGASNRTPQPLASFPGKLKEGSRLRVCDALDAETELVITFRSITSPEPKSARRQVAGVVQRVIGRTPLTGEIAFTTDACEPIEIGADLERCARASLGLAENTRLFLKNTVLPVVYSTVNGERKPIARREAVENVFYLGPQAGLPFPAEIAADVVGERDNAVALWRYSGEVTAFAEYYFANLARRDEALTPFTPTFQTRELRQSRQKKDVGDLVLAPVRAGSMEDATLPPEIETRRLLQYLLSEQLRSFRLPEGGIDRTLVLQLIPKQEDSEAALEVRADMPSIDGSGIKPLLEALATDPLLQQTVFRLGFPTRAAIHAGTARPVTMRVAVRRGRFLLRSVQEGDGFMDRFNSPASSLAAMSRE